MNSTISSSPQTPRRRIDLDVIRVSAILLVVANHAVESIFPFVYSGGDTSLFCKMPLLHQVFQFCVFTIGRMGVPLFLMLTGYLFLHRNYETVRSWMVFYRRNLIGLLLVWLLWILIFNIFFLVKDQTPMNWHDIVLECLLMKRVPIGHAWFMEEILFIYMIIPLLSYIAKRVKPLWIIISLILFLEFINNNLIGIPVVYQYPTRFICINYVLMGYVIYSRALSISNRLSVIMFFVLTIAIIYWQISMYKVSTPDNLWYTNIFLFVASSLLFILFLQSTFKSVKFIKTVQVIAVSSFGIYLVHYPVMQLMIEYLTCLNSPSVTNVMYLFVLTFVLSIIFVYFFFSESIYCKIYFLYS